MNQNEIFSTENVEDLKQICKKIEALCNEAIDGKFMATQLMFLGSNIKDFIDNPIVSNSDLLPK